MPRSFLTGKFRSNEVGIIEDKDSMQVEHQDNQEVTKGSGDSPVDGKRRCTDFLFLLLLVAALAAMTGVGLAATGVIQSGHIKKGDPRRLINGIDYYGNLCGVTNYEIPSGEDTINLPKAYPMPSGFSVCVESCPLTTDYDKFICEYDVQDEIDNLVASSDLLGGTDKAKRSLYLYYAGRNQCMPQIESLSFLGYCLPKIPLDEVILTDSNTQDDSTDTNSTDTNSTTPTTTTATDTSISIASMANSKSSDFYDQAMADVTNVRYVIFGFGCGMSLVLGIMFLVIIQLPGFLSALVWSMILLVDVGLAASGYYTKGVHAEWTASGVTRGNETTALFYVSYALYGLAGLWFIIILYLRKRIVLAIACVREAAKAIASMPLITVFPVFQVFGLVAFTIVWGVFSAYLASSSDIVASCMCPILDENATIPITFAESVQSDSGICDAGCLMHKELVYATNTKYAGLYLLFMWFWVSQFIVAVGQLVVATAISLWYFNRDRSLVKNSTFVKAFFLVVFNHLGTAAFGSLIIAIVKTIRAVLTYIQKKAAKSKLKIAVVILSVLKCLLWCVEKCLKFINKQAYIQTAIFGYSFCKASKEGFFLILRNVLRISAVSVVSQIVLFIGKVFITVSSAVGGYYYLEIHFGDELNFLMVPTLLIAIVAYAVSEMFNEVFGMAISTILQCFVVDEEMQSGYSPDSLSHMIDSTQQKYKNKKKVGMDES